MIPVNEPLFGELEKKYLNECIDTGWVSTEGPFVKEFEKKLADFLGVKSALAVSSGTSALETACYAVGVGAGDEVILPSFTIISCVAAIIRLGATPVVVDSDPKNWNMNLDLITQKITPKTKAIMAVHLYGFPTDMVKLCAIAKQHGLAVIEDCAQAFGSTLHGKKIGTFGDAAATSFFANKIITTGEGGMVFANDEKVIRRAMSYRNLFFGPGHERFVHEDLSYNFRMSNLQAAVGLGQVSRIEEFLAIKERIGTNYNRALSDLQGVMLPPQKEGFKNVYWMYGMQLDGQRHPPARVICEELGKAGVQTRPFFTGMHKQPALLKRGLFKNESCPVADQMSQFGFYIPTGLALTKIQQDKVIAELHRLLRSQG